MKPINPTLLYILFTLYLYQYEPVTRFPSCSRIIATMRVVPGICSQILFFHAFSQVIAYIIITITMWCKSRSDNHCNFLDHHHRQPAPPPSPPISSAQPPTTNGRSQSLQFCHFIHSPGQIKTDLKSLFMCFENICSVSVALTDRERERMFCGQTFAKA